MDDAEKARIRLRRLGVRYERGPGFIVLHPRSSRGFKVSIRRIGVKPHRSWSVAFEGWHKEFASWEEAFDCFTFGLSSGCRLKVVRRGGIAYGWKVESREDGQWISASETGLPVIPSWLPREVITLRNTVFQPAVMKAIDLEDFGTRYAAAWSSRDPELLASFYAESGSLRVNEGPRAVGRAAVEETARSFMTAFPDMIVTMTRLERRWRHPVFHWLWTGTNTGPGGTGKPVRMVGYEEWSIDRDGLIRKSSGHYDETEYARQLKEGAP